MRLVVPGKLMIAGEYAVLEPHCPALVVAVGPGLQADLWPDAAPCLALSGLGRSPVAWAARGGSLALGGGPDPAYRFAREALAAVLAYRGGELPPFALRVGALPEGPEGAKLGLGGSAAATVAVVAGALAASAPPGQSPLPAPDITFKLAAIAHVRAQGGGSGADVAASTYGGWLRYTSFTPAWLNRRLVSGVPLPELVAEPWPFFSVERLSPLPRALQLLAGFSGNSASTPKLVAAVEAAREGQAERYEHFLQASRVAVDHLVAGLGSANPGRALAALQRNGSVLAELGAALGVPIVTPALAELSALAMAAGAGAKSSGAGGGDCAVALAFDATAAEATAEAWTEAGYHSLRLEVAEVGARVSSLAEASEAPPLPEGPAIP